MNVRQARIAGIPLATDLAPLVEIAPQLVLVFGSVKPLTAPGLLEILEEVFPQAELAGCTTAGEIGTGGVTDGEIVITALHFSQSRLRLAVTDLADMEDSRAAGRRLGRALAEPELVHVLVLGQGQMGRTAAARISQQGYPVTGWRRDSGTLAPLLARSRIVINLLPLTPQTRGLLDASFFAALPAQASIVNLGRGAHVIDAELLAALDSGHLRHAVLDVFNTEPLPSGHPYWQHPRVTVLPHAAAATDPRSAAGVVAANLRALREGCELVHCVDVRRGY